MSKSMPSNDSNFDQNPEDTIHQITILGGSSREECDASCGEDWSSPEVIALARQRIKNGFGDKVRLEYLDLSKATVNRQTLEWSQVIRSKNLAVPLLLINGEPRISGQFDIRQLLDAIEAEMEIGAHS